uniref:Mannosyltransferase n=1 Tax=Alexandrium catenella TaxID=2925 RepID=A0A7S1M4P6_ALECA
MEAIPGVVLRELPVQLPRRRPEIWAVKPLAVAASNFREVLLLDADNVPAADLAPLFTAPDYVRTGALFWPDYPPYPEKEGAATWRALSAGRWAQRPAEICWEMESGQAVIDKERCGSAVRRLAEMALHLGELAPHLPGDGGDKDLFQMAWAIEGLPFSMCPYTPAAAGIEMEERRACPRGPFVGHTMVHHGPDGRPLFLHRTIDKHEDALQLAWRRVASQSGGARGKVGEQPVLELERIFPDARIKARIVPRSADAVDVVDFDEYLPQGKTLREAFSGLAEELRRQPWAG